MTIQEVKKQFEKLKRLISEHDQLSALLKSMNRTKERDGIEPDPVYLENIKRTLERIEHQFDLIFKNNILTIN